MNCFNKNFLLTAGVILLLTGNMSSCRPAKDVVYLQDIRPEVTMALQEMHTIKLQPGNKLSIIVHSRDHELVQMFNLQGSGDNAGASNNSRSLYTIDKDGKIDVPVLGLIHVQGLTRMELANDIKYRLLSANLVRDPIVTVEYANVGYSMLGEIGSPGRYPFERDQITLLEALAEAGDLTIQGRRDNILVLRTENGTQTPYRVDITKTNDLYASPVFYLQQNDLVYVEPNSVRANQSKLNANTTRTPAFWMSTASFLLGLLLLFTK